MTVERRALIRQEISTTSAVLTSLDTVARQLPADPDLQALEAVHLLLVRQLNRVDDLLLAMSADRLDDERNGLD